jgi:hypothetical protein
VAEIDGHREGRPMLRHLWAFQALLGCGRGGILAALVTRQDKERPTQARTACATPGPPTMS